MAAEKLKCKECGTATRSRRSMSASAASARSRSATTMSPATMWRRCGVGSRVGPRTSGATPTSCRSPGARRAIEPPRLQGGAARGLDAADQRRPACRSARPAGGVGQERRRQPDALLQGPGCRGRFGAGARTWFRGARLRLDRQPRQRRRRSGGGARTAVLRLHPGRPRGAEDPRNGVYGTNLVAVRGNYDDVNRLCTELSAEHDDWAFVNINMRPYYSEGSKTVAFEIVEQLDWELPDRCIVPVASGSLFTKIHRGFAEWIELGLVEGRQPVMNGAQASGCAPVANAFAAGQDFCQPVKPDTIAKSLAIGNPADGPYVLDLARRTGGGVDAVSDEQIREGSGCSRKPPGSSPRPPAESRGGAQRACTARRDRPRRAGCAGDHGDG